ncbi:MAG: hypothetical protein J7L30_04630 [Methanophagales archaeon]|nr:hypothetical protein [Methanophagales archaeon]
MKRVVNRGSRQEEKKKKMTVSIPIYTTENGTEIYVTKGTKSPYNFRVSYREPGKRRRTPKHIHIIIDLYMKKIGNKELTMKLVDHIINNIILKVKPATCFPPKLQIFKKEHVSKFKELEKYGEYSIEFLLVVTELIMLQEKTNFPEGTLHLDLYRAFRNEEDIFAVVSKATFRGR